MQYDFNSCPSRYGTNSTKWDGMAGGFGAECKYPLWIADMDFVSPPEVVKALQERVAHGVFGYSITPDSYLEAIVEWEKTRHNFAIEKDWILFSPGVVPGVYWSVNLFTQPGDKVMVLTPVYNPFFAAIKNQGRTLVECPLQRDERGHYGVDLDLFARTIRENDVKVFILCSPHNPVGRVWTRAEIDSMVDICVENGVLIVSDEIHQDIVFEGYERSRGTSTCPPPRPARRRWKTPSPSPPPPRPLTWRGCRTPSSSYPTRCGGRRYRNTPASSWTSWAATCWATWRWRPRIATAASGWTS